MSKIKVWLAVTKGNWGGAQKYVYDLATNLSKEKFEVAVVVGVPGQLVTKLERQNTPVYLINSLGRDINPLRDFISFWQLLRLLIKHRPDVLHLNSPKMGLLGALAGRLAGIKKIIYTSHGWPYFEDRSILSKLFFRILCWKITWLCHQTIVISKSEQRNNKKFNLIYNGIDVINFHERKVARQKIEAALGKALPADTVWLGTIAELHPNKGLKYAARAMAEVRTKHFNTAFIVIGEGEERTRLEGQLLLAGHIDQAASLLAAFDIFVLPSVKEGLPYVILEAGLASLPVIATRVGGIPEIIEDKVSGLLVTPKNKIELAETIETLINQPETRQIYGQNLRAKVLRDFSLEQMVEKTVKVYEK